MKTSAIVVVLIVPFLERLQRFKSTVVDKHLNQTVT